jgi:hypothetical protein
VPGVEKALSCGGARDGLRASNDPSSQASISQAQNGRLRAWSSGAPTCWNLEDEDVNTAAELR